MPRPLAALAVLFALVIAVAAAMLYVADRRAVEQVAERSSELSAEQTATEDSASSADTSEDVTDAPAGATEIAASDTPSPDAPDAAQGGDRDAAEVAAEPQPTTPGSPEEQVAAIEPSIEEVEPGANGIAQSDDVAVPEALLESPEVDAQLAPDAAAVPAPGQPAAPEGELATPTGQAESPARPAVPADQQIAAAPEANAAQGGEPAAPSSIAPQENADGGPSAPAIPATPQASNIAPSGDTPAPEPQTDVASNGDALASDPQTEIAAAEPSAPAVGSGVPASDESAAQPAVPATGPDAPVSRPATPAYDPALQGQAALQESAMPAAPTMPSDTPSAETGVAAAPAQPAAPIEMPLAGEMAAVQPAVPAETVIAAIPAEIAPAISVEATASVARGLYLSAEAQAGALETSTFSVAGAASGDVSAPNEAPVAAIDARDVSIRAAEAEADMLYVAGEAAPGALVRIYASDAFVGDARTDSAGVWLLEARTDVPVGEVAIRAEVGTEQSSVATAETAGSFMRFAEGIVLEPIVGGLTSGEDVASAEGAVTSPAYVLIRRGDNLWRIARRNYGRGIKYQAIFEANADRIRNPHRIYPGQVFVIPMRDRSWETAIN